MEIRSRREKIGRYLSFILLIAICISLAFKLIMLNELKQSNEMLEVAINTEREETSEIELRIADLESKNDAIAVSKSAIESEIARLNEESQKVKEEKKFLLASRGNGSRYAYASGHLNNDLIYTSVYIMTPTGYDLCLGCCGKSSSDPGYGVTASGYVITPGKGEKIAAVPPSIPLGKHLYIESLVPGVPDYGYAIAADRGGAIKGNRIDLYVDNHSQILWSGKNTVRVYVLD